MSAQNYFRSEAYINSMRNATADQDEKENRVNESINNTQVGGDHYKTMAVQPWDFLQSCLTPDEFRGFLKGEAIVYIAREGRKGGLVDLQKARHVLDKLIDTIESTVK